MDIASKQHSEEPTSTRKRKRKTYSCVDCRRRKLKCDREHPCGRCIKEGHPQSCAFRDDGHNSEIDEYDVSSRQYPAPESEKSSKLIINPNERTATMTIATSGGSFAIDQNVNLLRKIAQLEAKLAAFESPDHGQEANGFDSRQQAKESKFFKGTSFRSQFYGATNPTSLFSHFPEVFISMGREHKHKQSNLTRVQKDLLVMRNRRKDRKKGEHVHINTNLISLLPSQEGMDNLIRLYFDTYETALRIVHKPSFWIEYRASPVNQWKDSFVAVVLMMLASVNCVAVSKLSFKDDESSARVTAQRYVSAVDDWWNRQSQKHLTIETFQVKILLLLAKATNALKRKRAWANSGFLLRVAISAGFHREPSDLNGRISIFEEEMRRRLWATIFEWDLSASMYRGVPPMAASIPTDCRAPLNINDIDIDKDSQTLPEPRPLSERTDTSFLQVSLQSISLRTTLTSMLNDPNIQISWSEILSYEDKINQELDALPQWARERQTFNAVLLDLQLRQFMLWLYTKHARGPPGPRTAYARVACVNASTETIEMYLKLSAADVNALNMLRYDMYQCVVAISLNLLAEVKSASMAWSLINTLQPICEKAFLLLEDKVLKVGEGYNHMWFSAACFATAQTALDPSLGDSKAVAIDRVSKIYYKILAYQETDAGIAPGQTSSTNGNGTSWQTTPSASAGSVATPTGYGEMLKDVNDMLDFGNFPELAGWTNEDFFGFDTTIL